MSRKGSVSDILNLNEEQIRDKNFTKAQLIEAVISMRETISQQKNKERSSHDVVSTLLIEMNQKLDFLVTENKVLRSEVEELKKTVEAQSHVIEKHERYMRRSNIILKGVDESRDIKTQLTEVFDAIKVPFEFESDCENAYRIGKNSGNRSRLIKVVLRDPSMKQEILRAARDLQNVSGMANVYINNDLTPIQQEFGRHLRQIRDRERIKPENATKNVRIYNGAVYIDNVKVDENKQNFRL